MKEQIIINYLDILIPNPVCELNYTHDYELLIAVMLSAQTTDKRVNQVTSILFDKYPTLEALGSAKEEDIIKIIHPIGTYHKKAKNVIAIANKLKDLGYVPEDREYLESLPGVGRKTTNVVLAEIYDEQVLAVDTHIDRVAKRLGYAKKSDDVRTVEKKLTKAFNEYDLKRIHHQLLLFGRYYCTARKPNCAECKLKDICKYYKSRK